jgi:hypothetical protein
MARVSAGEVTGDASGLFFTNPGVMGSAQVDATLTQEPRVTMVFADDFLFWFVYGALSADRTPIKEESQRLQLLENGLAQLNRIVDAGVPLVVGDVPDMSLAVGKMLSKAQMPKLETIARGPRTSHAWRYCHWQSWLTTCAPANPSKLGAAVGAKRLMAH